MNAAQLAARVTLGLALGGWFGLSVLQQMDRTRLPRRVDPTSMVIPNWRFFAPVPARHDFNVLYRGRDFAGTVGDWQEESFTVPRALAQVFWHPKRRVEKAIFDVASELFQVSGELKDPRAIQLSVAYLSLLNYLTKGIDHPEGRAEVQFLIARSALHEPRVEPQLLFLSEWHRLSSDSPRAETSTRIPNDPIPREGTL